MPLFTPSLHAISALHLPPNFCSTFRYSFAFLRCGAIMFCIVVLQCMYSFAYSCPPQDSRTIINRTLAFSELGDPAPSHQAHLPLAGRPSKTQTTIWAFVVVFQGSVGPQGPFRQTFWSLVNQANPLAVTAHEHETKHSLQHALNSGHGHSASYSPKNDAEVSPDSKVKRVQM